MATRAECPTPTKDAHSSKAGARKEARSVERRNGVRMGFYKCACGKYHVTSRTRRKNRGT
jgi:uncharacterized cupin superfamily protein